ncbi:MAG: beta-propeller fold lactonase family protein [Verrucomicrobiales bacterium]|nr:beta-propeller fold lactonase family protein [Verrucomicrobiales bacterium]
MTSQLRDIGGAVLACLLTGCVAQSNRSSFFSTTERVGRGGGHRIVTPVNQVITPAGIQVDLPDLRPLVVALSPDGKTLLTSGKTSELLAVDPATGQIRQRVSLPSEDVSEPKPETVSQNILWPDTEGQASFTGLAFSPEGKRVYLSNVNGSIKVFDIAEDGRLAASFSIALPPANAPDRKQEIPAGLALSSDGRKLFVAFNLSNRLGEFDANTGQSLRTFDTGVAPYDVALVGTKAYVSNWGGRRPQPGDLTGPAGRGTLVKVDPVRHIASEGSVTVMDLNSGRTRAEILVHLHASALAVSPDRRYVVCANAASDNLSVIDTRTDKVVETIWAKQKPNDLFGASPNALAFDAKGKFLYVANGTQNAIGVIQFDPADRESRLIGLIPVGWFPAALAFDPARKQLVVANLKGHSPGRARKSNRKLEFNSHQYFGSLSLVPVPTAKDLPALSAIVWQNYRREQIALAQLPPRPNQPPRPVPERVGEPSVFEHVVYIIKENRTYDQVLGDEPRGNGDPELCIFPEKITPNQHKLVREFVLLDNTYCAGILSADGHQWSTTAFGTDYLEKSFAGWPRSYPDGMEDSDVDALAYAPSGFIWDNVLKHGKTVRSYGEFAITEKRWRDPNRKDKLDFLAAYRDFVDRKNEIHIRSRPAVESLRHHMNTNTVGWDMNIPDIYRAAEFIRELKAYEQQGGFPNLSIICLPNDHTSGTGPGAPTPAAQVADNDLAFGQIVEAIGQSKFWPKTVIFAIEDDPQAGWDHVSGYRTTAYVVSPYTKRGAVISTQYNTTSILRTIEQILGLPPMNQFDATATPMFDCFNSTPDLKPFTAVASNVALDEMNPDPKTIRDPLLRKNSIASSKLPLHRIDACPEDLFNRILWHAMKGSGSPYPQWAITAGAEDEDDD